MPITAPTDFISVARAQTHLRATAPTDELTDMLASAVAWVERHVQHPILDTAFRLVVEQPNVSYSLDGCPYLYDRPRLPYDAHFELEVAEHPIALRARGVRGTPTVRYWLPTQTLNETPEGSVTPARVEGGDLYTPAGHMSLLHDDPMLYPPDGGWPEALSYAPFVVEGNAGFNEVGDVPPQWKIAALQIVSAQYESPEVADKFARTAKALLAPFVRKGS